MSVLLVMLKDGLLHDYTDLLWFVVSIIVRIHSDSPLFLVLMRTLTAVAPQLFFKASAKHQQMLTKVPKTLKERLKL